MIRNSSAAAASPSTAKGVGDDPRDASPDRRNVPPLEASNVDDRLPRRRKVQPRQVLVVDDDPLSRALLDQGLRNLGFATLLAESAEHALARWNDARPRIVVSDWMMEGMDGLELCRRIRGQEAGEYTYFVFLTGRTRPEDRKLGFSAGADDYLSKPVDFDELAARMRVANRITELHSRLRVQAEELARLNHKLYADGRFDALTGIGNRLRLDEDLARLAHAATDAHHPLSLAIFDVDDFKLYNDTHGHAAGDGVLRDVAKALASTARAEDRVYRYGGEEFVAIFPGQGSDGARRAAERMRRAVRQRAIAHTALGPARVVTVSGGVAEWNPTLGESVEAAFERADAALYEAKAGGKDRVVVARGEDDRAA